THRGGGNAEKREADHDAYDREARGSRAVRVRPGQQRGRRVQRDREEKRGDREEGLERCICPKWETPVLSKVTVRRAQDPRVEGACEPRAERQPAHEGRQ